MGPLKHVRYSQEIFSAFVSVSAETDTEMSFLALFRSFGVGQNYGKSKYQNFGRPIKAFYKKTNLKN
jgi:hypothetical protein